jgi:hypothetical protein
MLQFIAVFYEQVRQFPTDFFHDELGKGNFLASCLGNLRTYESERTVNKKAQGRIAKLLALIHDKFHYDPTEGIEDEEQPVVVEGDESYF